MSEAAPTPHSEHLDWLMRASQDPAMRAMLLSRLGVKEDIPEAKPERPRALTGLPDFSETKIIQVGFFDNGASAKRRYGLAIEAWTCPPEEIIMSRKGYNGQKLNVMLYDYDEFPGVIKRHRGKMSQSWKDELLAVHSGYGPEWLIGPIYVSSHGLGSGFIEGQVVALHLPIDRPIDLIMANETIVETNKWATLLHDGKPLTGNCTYTARIELVHYRDGWAT